MMCLQDANRIITFAVHNSPLLPTLQTEHRSVDARPARLLLAHHLRQCMLALIPDVTGPACSMRTLSILDRPALESTPAFPPSGQTSLDQPTLPRQSPRNDNQADQGRSGVTKRDLALLGSLESTERLQSWRREAI